MRSSSTHVWNKIKDKMQNTQSKFHNNLFQAYNFAFVHSVF